MAGPWGTRIMHLHLPHVSHIFWQYRGSSGSSTSRVSHISALRGVGTPLCLIQAFTRSRLSS